MSSMYFIIFGILQDFTPKGCHGGGHARGGSWGRVMPPNPPRRSHAFGVRFAHQKYMTQTPGCEYVHHLTAPTLSTYT